MIVEVTNTDEAEEDGFWVEFQGTDGVDGVGVWEETVEPNQYVEFDEDYMPHAIVRNGDEVHLLLTERLSMKNVVQVIMIPIHYLIPLIVPHQKTLDYLLIRSYSLGTVLYT